MQHSAYRNCNTDCSTSVFAEYRKNVLSRRTTTRSSFFSLSRWWESVECGMSSSDCMSPTTKPSGWADKRSCMMRNRASVPIAANTSANLASCSAFFLEADGIFLYLPKYRYFVKAGLTRFTEARDCRSTAFLQTLFLRTALFESKNHSSKSNSFAEFDSTHAARGFSWCRIDASFDG